MTDRYFPPAPRARSLPRAAAAWLAVLVATAGSGARAFEPSTLEALELNAPRQALPAPGPGRGAAMQPVPGLEINYDLLSPSSPAPGATPGPARLQGKVSSPLGHLSASLLVNPTAPEGERLSRLDTRWQAQLPGPVQTLVVGDAVGGGGGWSPPVRYGGLRLGRAVNFRDAPVPLGPTALPERVALPVLQPGTSDYEFEAGRLRTGWGTAADHYGDGYAAVAWRQGLLTGLNAEARAEWTPLRLATGLELNQGLGRAGTLRAVLARASASTAGATPQSGMRWGMGWVRNTDGGTWNLTYDSFERGYIPLAGNPAEASPRNRVQAGAKMPLWGKATGGLSYSLQNNREGPSDSQLGVVAQVPLAQRTSLSLSVTQRPGTAPGWQAGLTLPLP